MLKLKRLVACTLTGACLTPVFADEEKWFVEQSNMRPENLSKNNALTNSEQYQKNKQSISNLQNVYEGGADNGKLGGERIESQLKSRANQTQILKNADELVRSKKQVQMDHSHPFITESKRGLYKIKTDVENSFGVVVEKKQSGQKLNLKPLVKTCREAALWEQRKCQMAEKSCIQYLKTPKVHVVMNPGSWYAPASDGSYRGAVPLNWRKSVSISPDEWISECNHLEKRVDCQLDKTECIDKSSVKTIQGKLRKCVSYGGWQNTTIDELIKKDCWKRKRTYFCKPSRSEKSVADSKVRKGDAVLNDCERLEALAASGFCNLTSQEKNDFGEMRTYFCGGDSEKNECEILRKQGCLQVQSDCVIEKNGICIEWKQHYDCPQSKALQSSGLNLDGETIRIGFEVAEPQSESFSGADFADAAAKLSIFNKLKRDQNDTDENPLIFTGEKKSCPIILGGSIKDCCNFRGIIKNWFGGCGRYKKLAEAVLNAKVCHLVERKWCAKKEKITKICLKKETTYCCYKNKLARIIQEIAHQQLGLGWGTGKSPNCSPISAEQLSRINFDTAFAQSKLAEYVQEQASRMDQVATRVQRKFKQAGNIKQKGLALQHKMQKKLSHLKNLKPKAMSEQSASREHYANRSK